MADVAGDVVGGFRMCSLLMDLVHRVVKHYSFHKHMRNSERAAVAGIFSMHGTLKNMRFAEAKRALYDKVRYSCKRNAVFAQMRFAKYGTLL